MIFNIIENIAIVSILSLIWVLAMKHQFNIDGGSCLLTYIIINLVNIAAIIKRYNE